MICNKNKCTGCGLCKNICPLGCIQMKYDEEGFLHPTIDKNKCVKCNKCIKNCPSNIELVKNPEPIPSIVYACWNKNISQNLQSSSGGIFPVLAEFIIKNGGKVVGSAMTNKLTVEYTIIDKLEDIQLLTGSKYIQSDTKNIYKTVKQELKNNNKILFVGCPCQIAPLYSMLTDKELQNLTTVDLVCHGVGSKTFFDKYIREIENKYNQKIIKYEFRTKKRGWKWHIAKITFESGKTKYIYSFNDAFMKCYMQTAIYRESCYNCKYAKLPRNSDITLGDFFGINRECVEKEQIRNGISTVIINTSKGNKLFNSIKDQIEYIERPLSEATQTNLNIVIPSKRPIARDKILKEKSLSAKKISKKYCDYKSTSKLLMYIGNDNLNSFLHKIKRRIK